MSVPKEISELIGTSGNNFHAKVARWFTANGWHVVVSPYYMDQTQGKAREIDLIAEKLWPTTDAYGRPADNIMVRLFIECKFVASNSVFWFTEKDRSAALDLVCASGAFRPDNSYTEQHHYLSQCPKVAKLFSTSNFKAAESEPFYKALNQVLNAMVSMRSLSATIPRILKSGRYPKSTIDLPVVVCSSFDRMYALDFFADSEPEPIKDNFQLEVRYAFLDRNENKRSEYFLLDFVSFENLGKFGDAVDVSAKSAATLASD